MKNKWKRGFFTIAFGKHYQKIAYNLFLTAKYNNVKYPFAIVTDCSSKYTKAFDFEIIKKQFSKGCLNKLFIDEYAPFDESIFLDADNLIFNDISFMFDLVFSSKINYIAFGNNYRDKNSMHYFSLEQAKKLGVNYSPSFNGGIYFYKKNNVYKKIFKDARSILKKHINIDLKYPEGDECYISLSAAMNDAFCFEKISPLFFGNYYHNIKVFDLINHKLISKNGDQYYIYHSSTQQTYGTIYKKQIGMLKYKDTPLIIFYKLGIYSLFSRTVNLIKKFWA